MFNFVTLFNRWRSINCTFRTENLQQFSIYINHTIFSFHNPCNSLSLIFAFTHLQNSETNSQQILHKTNGIFSCKTQKLGNSWLQLIIGMMENTQKDLWQTKTNSMISVCGGTMCCCQVNDCIYIQVQFSNRNIHFILTSLLLSSSSSSASWSVLPSWRLCWLPQLNCGPPYVLLSFCVVC